MSFNTLWRNITHCAGQQFTTKTGLLFTYQIINGAVVPDRTQTQYPLTKRNFEKASQVKGLTGPGMINNLVRGPAYVYAILTDERIK